MGSNYSTNYLDLLKKISRAAMSKADSIEILLEGTLNVIGDNLGADLCAIYETGKSKGFQYLCGYKIESYCHGECLIKLMKESAENSIKHRKITCTYVESAKVIYFVPVLTDKFSGMLTICFDFELGANGLEVLEAIGSIISASLDRFFLRKQIDQQYLGTVKSLIVAIEAKDVYTQGHSQRVADYSSIIGTYLKLKENEVRELEVAGLVHDIGKIGINDQLLTKSDRLTEMEFESMRQHPEIGSKILQPLNVSENIMVGTLLHHKRYDLKGYPYKLDIDKLPMVPAIIGAADAFDAMTSERNYRTPISKQDAVIELKTFRGTQFHPEIVDVIEELVHYNKI